MKRNKIILVIFCSLLMSSFQLTAQKLELKKKDKKLPNTRSLVYVPISSEITANSLLITFEEPIGLTTIIVENQNGYVVSETINTESITEWSVIVSDWENGTYLLSIAYDNIELEAEFQLIQ